MPRWPIPCSTPCCPVVEAARDVSLDLDRLAEHAGWMAYEELPPPAFILPFPLELDRDEIVDFVLTATSINFAFTDFETRRALGGRRTTAACSPTPTGCTLPAAGARRGGAGDSTAPGWREVTEDAPARDLPRRQLGAAAPRRAGADLARGRRDARRALRRTVLERVRARPRALRRRRRFLELLTRDFPRFDDTAAYDGREVRFWKLAQLSVWILQATLPAAPASPDLDRLTAFADYIVPAALRVLGITRYSRRARGGDPRGPADRGRVAVGGRDPRAHDLRVRRARAARSTSCARPSCR